MTNEGSKGTVIITWKNVSNAEIQSIISALYMKNQGAISGMKYYEVRAEDSEIVDNISNMFEKQVKKAVEVKKTRRERGLESFC